MAILLFQDLNMFFFSRNRPKKKTLYDSNLVITFEWLDIFARFRCPCACLGETELPWKYGLDRTTSKIFEFLEKKHVEKNNGVQTCFFSADFYPVGFFLSVWFLWIFHYLEISRKLSKIFEFQILEILTIPILKTNDFFFSVAVSVETFNPPAIDIL